MTQARSASLTLEASQSPATTDSGRWPAAAVAVAAIVSTIFVAMDRSAGGGSPAEILAALGNLLTLKEWVHGVAIAATCAYAFGFGMLAQRLGMRRPLVVHGLVAYLAGCGALIGATIFDGFITPHIAADGAAALPQRVAFAYNLVHYLGVVVNDLAKTGWVLQAVGALGLAAALRRDAKMTALLGIASGVLTMAAIAASSTFMEMQAILAVLLAQTAWNLAAAVHLWRR
jgi:hypothetical protein